MTALRQNPWTIPLADGPVSPFADRLTALIVGGLAAVVIWSLSRVAPDGRGHGTHEQLGMDPCGWSIVYGIPCPTCGCTTAATQLLHGDVFGAFATQPFGAALALIGLLAGVHAWMCLLRTRSFVDVIVRLPFWRIVLSLFLLFWAAWGYKYLIWES